MNLCRPWAGVPRTSVATQFAMDAKKTAMDHRKIQTKCGIARSRRKKTVSRRRSRSSRTTSRTGCSGCIPHLWQMRQTAAMAIDKETADRIDQPVPEEAEREVRLTPSEAVERMRINVPVRGNRKLRTIIERINADKQVKAWWHVSNVNAVARMEINDHSWVHVQIVANIALKLLRQLTKHGVESAMVRDYSMTNDDAEVVVTLAALFHCIGMSIHRHGHEDFSLFLAEPKLRELLTGVYDEPERTVVVSEVLQAIISHRADGEPLTTDAGIVRVADALDMAKGRSRIGFERGRVSMHSLSAAAIDDVTITDGDDRPILIEIKMNNSSGLFQVDGLLRSKLRGSRLEPYVEVVAHIDTETEQRLVPMYRLDV